MPEPEMKHDNQVNDGAKIDLEESNEAAVKLELDEAKAHLINANGGASSAVDELKIAIVDPTSASSEGEISFNGLGKEEVMRYANDPFWVRLRWILFILFWVGWLAMLVTAIIIIVLAPRCPPRPDLKWYQTETIYQVFPKSFKDSNDDGIGDFGGLKEKFNYITGDLGIKAVWINSIFESDEKSSLGVLDHKKISESFGASIEDFKDWLRKLRKEGIKIILDLIPNQTSKNHTWFQKSLSEEQYKDYYIWAKGNGAQPPNNWKTVNGDPAWTNIGNKTWYFHQFSSDFPDLNLTNENVQNEFKDIIKFWMEAGVSGFHIQGLEYLVENPDIAAIDDAQKSHTRNYVGTYDFLEVLRAVVDGESDKPGREKLLFGTVEFANRNQTLEYFGAGDKKRLHIVAPLWKELDKNCNASCIKNWVEEQLTEETGQWLGLQLGNENTKRIASRLDDGTKLRLIVAYALQMLLPGTPINYYGDEFGQRDGLAGTADPEDDHRRPMQWNNQENAGFCAPGVRPWIPVGPNYTADNAQAAKAHFLVSKTMEKFEELVKLRRKESFQWGKTQLCVPHAGLLIFTRASTRFPFFLVIISTSNKDFYISPEELKCVPAKDEGKIVFHSRNEKVNETISIKERGISLAPFDVIVLELAAEE